MSSEPTIEGSDQNQTKLLAFASDLVVQAESDRDERERIWRELIMSYNGLTGRKYYIGRANLHVPLTFQMVETFVPRVKRGIYSQEVPFEVRPRGKEDDDKDEANTSRSILAYQLDAEMKFKKKLGDIIRTSEVIGRVVGKLAWRHEEEIRVVRTKQKKNIRFRGEEIENSETGEPIWDFEIKEEEKRVTTYDGNDIIVLDPFSIFVDELTPDQDINKARYVIHREMKTWEELKLMYGDNLPDDMFKAGAGEVEEEKEQILRMSGANNVDNNAAESPQARTFRHDEMWFDWDFKNDDGAGDPNVPRSKNCMVVLIDGRKIVRAQRNPFHHGRKPFVSYSPMPRFDSFWGNGTAGIVLKLQWEANDTRNQIMDWKSRALNAMFIVGRAAGVKDNQIRFRQGGIIRVNDIQQIREVALQNIMGIAQATEAQIEGDMRAATGATRALGGVPLGSVRSATENANLVNEGSARVEDRVEEFEEQWFLPMLEMMWQNNRQFIRGKRQIRLIEKVMGPIAAEAVKGRGFIDQEDLLAPVDIVMMGAKRMALEGAKGAQFMQFAQFALQLDPTIPQNGIIIRKIMAKLWTDFFRLDGEDFAETFNQVPIEDLAGKVIEQLMAASAQESAREGGGGTENPSGSDVPQGPLPGAGQEAQFAGVAG